MTKKILYFITPAFLAMTITSMLTNPQVNANDRILTFFTSIEKMAVDIYALIAANPLLEKTLFLLSIIAILAMINIRNKHKAQKKSEMALTKLFTMKERTIKRLQRENNPAIINRRQRIENEVSQSFKANNL